MTNLLFSNIVFSWRQDLDQETLVTVRGADRRTTPKSPYVIESVHSKGWKNGKKSMTMGSKLLKKKRKKNENYCETWMMEMEPFKLARVDQKSGDQGYVAQCTHPGKRRCVFDLWSIFEVFVVF